MGTKTLKFQMFLHQEKEMWNKLFAAIVAGLVGTGYKLAQPNHKEDYHKRPLQKEKCLEKN